MPTLTLTRKLFWYSWLYKSKVYWCQQLIWANKRKFNVTHRTFSIAKIAQFKCMSWRGDIWSFLMYTCIIFRWFYFVSKVTWGELTYFWVGNISHTEQRANLFVKLRYTTNNFKYLNTSEEIQVFYRFNYILIDHNSSYASFVANDRNLDFLQGLTTIVERL